MWLSSETSLKIDGEFDGVYRAANTDLLHFDGDMDDEVQGLAKGFSSKVPLQPKA